MLPSLLRQCWSQGTHVACKQLVSLSAFNVRNLGPSTDATAIPAQRRHSRASRFRDVTAAARRRNVFLDPAAKDEELTTLYGSGRFNDDDEEDYTVAAPDPEDGSSDEEADAPPAPAAAAAAAPAAPADGTEVRLPPARNVRVKTAEFIKSSPDVASCPPAVYPEFAVIGRSNVGKSSLINLLTGRNALAMVSKTPGKTKLINHFLINGAWYLVDLPGYGYARASKDKVLTWNRFTREYFLQRPTLASVLLLIDASIPPMELDISCANWLGEAGVAYTLVYTKMDKRKKGEQKAADNIAAFEAALAGSCDALPPAVATSARSGAGKAELLAHIARLRGLYNAQRA